MKVISLKVISLFVLVISILTIFAPLRIDILNADDEYIVYLDVCSHDYNSLSGSFDIPYLTNTPETTSKPELSGTIESTLFVLNLPIIIHSEEKPPRV